MFNCYICTIVDIKSVCFEKFLEHNKDLIKYILELVDLLFLQDAGGPEETSKGLSLSADSPRSNCPTLNYLRKAPTRQLFGEVVTRYDPLKDTPQGYTEIYIYGSGSGKSTVGTPKS